MNAPALRALHLFSNSKWTGPAEPALRLALMLRELGVDIEFACSPHAGSGFNKIRAVAREHGLEPLDFMRLQKHRHPFWNWLDARALRRYLGHRPCDLVHCHLDNDHAIAARAMGGTGLPLVRSSYEGAGMAPDRRHGKLARSAAAIIEPSRKALEADARHFALPAEGLHIIPGAIDVERFDPGRTLPVPRAGLGIPEDAFVLGIVARMQTHRHYEDLFQAFAQFVTKAPDAHLIVVGRGTRQEKVAFMPARELGVTDRVHFPGYIEGDNYVAMLAAFDVGLFLTPGTDGTCRAAREIMAMGKPMVVANRGMLDEIVTHEHNGLVTDGSPEALAKAFVTLRDSRETRGTLGENARRTAASTYSLAAQARATLRVYRHVLEKSVLAHGFRG